MKREREIVKVSRETFLDYYDKWHSDEQVKRNLLERNIEIFQRRVCGETFTKIAKSFDMSGCTVSIIYRKMRAHALQKHRGKQVEQSFYHWDTTPLGPRGGRNT